MDTHFDNRTPLRKPEFSEFSQAALPSLPNRNLNVPWPDMPEKMLVVIDGCSDTKKALVGQWVAEAWGGLLVESDVIYRSLVAACSKAGVDVNTYAKVESWCEQAGVDIGFAKDDGHVLKAHAAVNGLWFAKSDLENHSESVSNQAAYATFWGKVKQALRGCDFDDRVVVVGSDVGYEFPATPYKFFLDKTNGDRNRDESAFRAYPWAGDPKPYKNRGPTYFNRVLNTLMIDASQTELSDLVMIVLVESAARAFEMGFLSSPLEAVVAEACDLAGETRKRLNEFLSRQSK